VAVEQLQEKHTAGNDALAPVDEHYWRLEEMAVEAVVREALGDRALLCRVMRRQLPWLAGPRDTMQHTPIVVRAAAQHCIACGGAEQTKVPRKHRGRLAGTETSVLW
jgi:hypothetical protein